MQKSALHHEMCKQSMNVSAGRVGYNPAQSTDRTDPLESAGARLRLCRQYKVITQRAGTGGVMTVRGDLHIDLHRSRASLTSILQPLDPLSKCCAKQYISRAGLEPLLLVAQDSVGVVCSHASGGAHTSFSAIHQ